MAKITYDAAEGVSPAEGDVLVTRRGRRYLIVETRRVRSTVYPNRWALGALIVEGSGGRELPLFWNPRGRSRDVRRRPRRC